jgi:hypothetical protein
MAGSGVYSFSPDLGDFCQEAFERALKDPTKIERKHWDSALLSVNLLFSSWANEGVHLFAVEEFTQTVTQGLEYYSAPTGTLTILEAVVRRDGLDTPVHNMTRGDYHLIPDKATQGLPTGIWLDRKTGLYYLWQVPENGTDVIRAYRVRQIQSFTAGQETPDVPFRWFEALASGLAAKIAQKFNKPEYASLQAAADAAFLMAKRADRERADTSFGLGTV